MCKPGIQFCINGTWGDCINETKPMDPVCSSDQDYNCNGIPDKDEDVCKTEVNVGPSCYDGEKNGNEEGIDCGGDCPPCEEIKCPNCNNRKKDCNEEGIDCGGPDCPPCGSARKKAAKPKKEEKEEEEEEEPFICGDGVCDEELGENPENCPEDCKKFPIGILIFIILLLILGGGGFFAWKLGYLQKFIKIKKPKKEGRKEEEKLEIPEEFFK